MKHSKLCILILFTSICQTISAQEEVPTTKSKYTIPFQLTAYNNISIKAILNDQDTVMLMFHTAANFVTLTEEATAKLKSIQFNGTTDSIKSWGGQDNSARLSQNNSLQIGELEWIKVPLWENKNSGQNTDGKFGINLFANKVIEIDFDKKVIVLYKSVPAKIKNYEKLKLAFKDDELFVQGACSIDGDTITNQFLIHSGYSGAVLLDDGFVNANKVGEKLKITGEKKLKDSYGNILKTKKAILPVFKLGNEKLYNVPVGFFEGAIGMQKMSIIGGDVLKRFNIIIDAKREYIYLKANNLKTADYSKG